MLEQQLKAVVETHADGKVPLNGTPPCILKLENENKRHM